MYTRSRPEPARFDPFLHDDDLRKPYQVLFKAEWEELDDLLATEPNAWLAASILVNGDAAIEPDVFQHYVAGGPSAYSLSMLGGSLARSSLPPANDPGGQALTQEQRDQLTTRLLAAERYLFEAIGLDHLVADPWVHLLTSGRGLRVSLRELRQRFENANSRAPFRQDACIEYLLGLSGRGGPDDKAMFDFVRWLVDTVPAGAPATITVPMAHIEHGFRRRSRTDLDNHLRKPATVGDLTESLTGYLQHSAIPPGPPELVTLNAFALALVVEDRTSALLIQDCYARIDNRPTSYPWSILINEGAEVPSVFCEHQRHQLEAASRFIDE